GRKSQSIEASDIIVTTDQFGAAEPIMEETQKKARARLLPALEKGEVPDVDGVLTANPSEVPDARTLLEISYSEASELAYYGAKVLHYKTILPAFRKRIPVRILNSFNPSHPGT